MRIIGYGICGANEKRLENTLKEFKRLCDATVIVGNKIDEASARLIADYGFDLVIDDREWGTSQHLIKENLVANILPKYKPEGIICLDMDEVFEDRITRQKLEEMLNIADSLYFYIVNLWNNGWKRKWSFWNIRAWKWNGNTKFVKRPLHCGLAPEWCYYYGSNIPYILFHYGLKDKDDRQRKVARYQKFDPKAIYRDKSYYDGLLDDSSEAMDLDYIKQALQKEVGQIKSKKIIMETKKRFAYVKNSAGVVYDIPEKDLAETLKRPGFTFVSWEDESQKEMEKLFGDEPVNEEPVAKTENPVVPEPETRGSGEDIKAPAPIAKKTRGRKTAQK